MQYTTLGRTGLKVSVAAMGCGGSSCLGLSAGRSVAQCAGIIHQAVDLGVNLIDTAKSYGTEPVVGAALKTLARDAVVLSTKHKVAEGKTLLSAAQVVAGLDNSLKTLGTDYVDIFFLHTVLPDAYTHAYNEIAPVLLREKEKGKFRFLGITEMPPRDARHDTLQAALKHDCWDVTMFAFHMLGQNARHSVFPLTRARNIGTMMMFAVRSLFSTPGRLQQDIQALVDAGKLPAWLAAKEQPLDFLLHEGNVDGARNVIEAAYRYVRHEPGADVVLFGTGNPAHVAPNIEAILQPPLPPDDVQKLAELFGHLEGVGLDEPKR
jgi:aryl-alcohol dehydrogenase-like predicted oxidoreductase